MRILFFLSLLAGTVISIPVVPGVTIYLHEFVLLILLITHKIRRPKLFIPIILFVSAALLSLLANAWRFPANEIAIGSLYLVRWIFYGGVYAIVASDKRPKDWRSMFFATGVAFGILGLIQYVVYPDLRNLIYLGWDPHYRRLFSTLLDPNFTGILLVFTVLLGLSLKRTTLVVVGQGIAVISLLLTYSRSSFLALVAAIVTITIARKQWKLFGAAAGFIVLVLLVPQTHNELRLLRQESTVARLGNWKESIARIRQAPVFGYGFNTLRYLNEKPGEFVSKSASGVDSSILFIVMTSGLIGLIAYGYLLSRMIHIGRRSQVYIASFVALGIHSLFVNSAFYPWVMIWMWVLTALAERNYL